MALPGAHAIGHTVVEARRAHDSLYASEPHSLSHRVAHTGEGDGYTSALRLLDGVQQRVAGGGVDEVHRICVQKDVIRGRAARSQRRSQTVAEVTDAREEHIPARAQYPQPGKSERLGVVADVALGLGGPAL